MIDLNRCAADALKVAIKRKLKNILKHTATEVVEAQEAYTRYKTEYKCIDDGCMQDNVCAQSLKTDIKDLYADELADIIICALIAAAQDNIDIEKAVTKKMAKNELRAVIGDSAHE